MAVRKKTKGIEQRQREVRETKRRMKECAAIFTNAEYQTALEQHDLFDHLIEHEKLNETMCVAFGPINTLLLTTLVDLQRYLLRTKKIKAYEYFYFSQWEMFQQTGIPQDIQTDIIETFEDLYIIMTVEIEYSKFWRLKWKYKYKYKVNVATIIELSTAIVKENFREQIRTGQPSNLFKTLSTKELISYFNHVFPQAQNGRVPTGGKVWR